MAKKTDTTTEPTADQQLEAKVDQMMDMNAKPSKQPDTPVETTTPPPLDIFSGGGADQTSASPVPGAPTLPDKKAAKDELAEAIAPEPDEVIEDKAPALPDGPTVDSADTVVVAPANLDTPESDVAIADIVAQEADQALAAEDAGIQAAQDEAEELAPAAKEKHGHPVFWFIIVLLVAIIIFAVVVLTNSNFELPFSA